MYRFQQRLKNFKQHLKNWNKTTFGNILQSIQTIEHRLEELQQTFISGLRTPDLMKEEAELQVELDEWKKQEEIMWRQKSRVQWLKEGERNTKFFHRAVVHHRYINRITQLEDAQGNPIREHKLIAGELNSYYKELLMETNENREDAIQKITRHIPKLVTQEQNEALMRPITQDEVDKEVKDMPSGKSPGPDGFTTDFFHHCWDLIKEEVWQVVEESRTSGQVLSALNATFLTLILKEERVTHPKQYRSISLCNVIYKIITKVIAMRLKPILPFVISKEQTGLRGRTTNHG
jgi:hypothetical protein